MAPPCKTNSQIRVLQVGTFVNLRWFECLWVTILLHMIRFTVASGREKGIYCLHSARACTRRLTVTCPFREHDQSRPLPAHTHYDHGMSL